MAKIFRNYNTLAEYETDTNKPVNTVCFIKDAKVIYVDGIRYSYKQLDYLPPAISEAEALEYVEYNTDDKNEVDGRILLIKDSNVTDVIEGDLFNTSVLIPNDVDIISFKTEDEAKEYCNEEGYIYPSSK